MNHYFDVDVAVRCGVNAAILFQNIGNWCQHNMANGKHFYDGRYWTYNSVKAFQELYPYFGAKQISNAIEKLIENGLIVKGEFNQKSWDRTNWYSLTEEGWRIFRYGVLDYAKRENGDTQKGVLDYAKRENGDTQKGKPIPYINHIYNNYYNSARVREETNNNDEYNPFGDDAPDHPDRDTLEVFAADNIINMDGYNMELLVDYMARLPEDLIRYAIEQANKYCRTGKPTFGYVETILKSFISQGFKSAEQAKLAEQARDEEKERKGMSKERYDKQKQEQDDAIAALLAERRKADKILARYD